MEPVPARRTLSSPLARLLLLALLMLALLIPLGMIGSVVSERAARRGEAVADITAHWGGAQQVVGPLLRATCFYRHEETDDKGRTRVVTQMRDLYLLPERLDADGGLSAELRHRGIFTVPVYAAALKLEGSFARPTLAQCPGDAVSINASRVDLVLGLSQPRSLRAEAGLMWNGVRLDLKPTTGATVDPLRSGVHVSLDDAFPADTATFSLVLGFNGAERLMLAPLGKDSSASLHANWPHPGFQGASLPARHEEDARGFAAAWSMSYLGRDFPQVWTAADQYAAAVAQSLFGVNLTTPADPYVQAARICRYAVLTLVFTFGTVWLMEVIAGVRVHAIQYGFVGAALCLFSLLQISFAEHFGFDAAFIVAAGAVILQVTLYCRSILRNARRTATVAAILCGLYAYLFAILKAEDYALLGGALALFGMLSVAMFLTRRVDWSGAAPTA